MSALNAESAESAEVATGGAPDMAPFEIRRVRPGLVAIVVGEERYQMRDEELMEGVVAFDVNRPELGLLDIWRRTELLGIGHPSALSAPSALNSEVSP